MQTPDRQALRRQVIALGIVAGAGVLLGLLGPFGTFAMGGTLERIALWLLLVLPGYLVYMPAIRGSRWLAAGLSLPFLPVLLTGLLAASAPMTMLVALFMARIGHPVSALALYPQVALVGVLIGLVFWWRLRGEAAPLPAADGNATSRSSAFDGLSEPLRPALLDRLPRGHDGIILALESEDHYVRVHGRGRSDLVLIRMDDAVAEAAPLEGLRVHRSWWAARDAVELVERDGRTMRLVLAGGLHVPVSRANQRMVTQAGW
jgi:hypothetical protein